MNKFKRIFTIFLIFFFIYILFRYNYTLESSVTNAFYLWLHKVFPSLFIMFILNDLIINLNLLNNISKPFNYLFNKIFKTSKQSGEAFLLSILSSTPTSTFIIKSMYEQNKISYADANKLLYFTYFSNPLFLYNILLLSFNKYITLKIIFIHYLSNIIIGLIFRNNPISDLENNSKQDTSKNILTLLPNSIKNSINTLLVILGTISFYMIITNIFINFGHLNNINSLFLKGLLEITQALNYLPQINLLSIIKEILAIAIISFGGFSIHTQVLSIIIDSKIKYKYFLIGRIFHVLISTVSYLMITILFN